MSLDNWKLPAVRPSNYATPPDLTARRAAAGSAPSVAPAPDVTVSQVTWNGVRCVVCTPANPLHTALYFHGGGYRLGSAERSTPFGTRLAAAMHATTVIVGYRLAPEHPFPAGLHDAASVYDHVLAESNRAPLVVGDSAGGGLAAALAAAAGRAGIPPPAALVAMSPWLDLTCTAGTFRSRASTDQLFSLAAAQQGAEMYTQGHDAADPLVSPLFADVEWPRSLIFASTDEVLLDDSIRFTSRLALAGVEITTSFEPGVPHAWPAVMPDRPESATAVQAIGTFARSLK